MAYEADREGTEASRRADAPARPAVRPATDADGPAIAGIMRTVFAAYPHCFFVPEEVPELAAVASHYAAKDGAAFVAEADGQVVGSLAIFRTNDPAVFELSKVYLLPPFRGRGTAGEMLARAEAVARAAGGRRLRLWSDTKFAEGHAFYRRTGFRQLSVVRWLNDASLTWEHAFEKPVPSAPAGGGRGAR